MRLLHQVADLYTRDIIDAGRQPQFLVLISFLLTFVFVRLLTHAIRRGTVPHLRNFTPGGRHVHHLVWGILLLLISGYIAIAVRPSGDWNALALCFGAGAALTLDEFALWLELKDVYWARDGRRSIDAVVVVAILLGLFTVGMDFWLNLGRLVGRVIGVNT